jgi:hypothetical protein
LAQNRLAESAAMSGWLLGLIAVLSATSIPGDADFLPISLSCPEDNDGVLEVVTRNRAGQRQRFQAVVANGQVTYAARGEADLGRDFDEVVIVTLSAMTVFRPDGSVEVERAGANSQHVAAAILSDANALGGDSCIGSPAARRQHAELLTENRRSLGLE